MGHILDTPAWASLTTRLAALSIGSGTALRFRPDINIFAGAPDRSEMSLADVAALVPPGGTVGLVEAEAPPALPGLGLQSIALIHQMVATRAVDAGREIDFEPLGDADAAEMFALASLTRPGPYFSATHRMGRFIGVRRDGRLIAMAGERFSAPGFTEISAVCTHPDHRGQGLAGALMRRLHAEIMARGDTPFLHVYPDNPAVALYQAMGLRHRKDIHYTVFERPGADDPS